MCQTQGDGFRYDIYAPRVRFTDRTLLDVLKRWGAMRKGKRLGYKDFVAWKRRPFHPRTLVERFGSWCNALSMVGLRGTHAMCDDPEKLVANLGAVWRQVGRAPHAGESAVDLCRSPPLAHALHAGHANEPSGTACGSSPGFTKLRLMPEGERP